MAKLVDVYVNLHETMENPLGIKNAMSVENSFEPVHELLPKGNKTKTKITVYLQGTSREYSIDLPLNKVIEMYEQADNILIIKDTEYVSINNKNISIIEFEEQ